MINKFLPGILLIISFCFLITSCETDDELDDLSENNFEEMITQDPVVELNPSGNTPLSARISLQTEFESNLKVEVLGTPPLSYRIDNPKNQHDLPVVGLFPEKLNRVIVTLTDSENRTGWDTFQIQTAPVPEFFPEIEIQKSPPASEENFMTLAELDIGNGGVFHTYPTAFDVQGNIRWYMDLSFLGGIIYPVRILENGNLCFGRGSQIAEYDWLGFEQNQWSFDGFSQHHELLELPNGNFILAVNNDAVETVEDHIIELDRASGNIVREWDMRQHLDVDRFTFIENEEDWFHMNGIHYNDNDQSLIVSGRHQGLAKITQSDELEWIMAPHLGWGKAGVNGQGPETSEFLLSAVDESGTPYGTSVQEGTQDAQNFSWGWGQHAPLLLSNGNLFVFDNGDNRNFGTGENFSRGVEYSVNSSENTVTQEWQYGAERGEEMYADIVSDVDISNRGSRILTAGIVRGTDPLARIVEVNHPGKEVLFEATLSFKNALANGTGWGNFDLVYRSERFHFYE